MILLGGGRNTGSTFFISKRGVWAGEEAIEKRDDKAKRQQFRGKESTGRAGEETNGSFLIGVNRKEVTLGYFEFREI